MNESHKFYQRMIARVSKFFDDSTMQLSSSANNILFFYGETINVRCSEYFSRLKSPDIFCKMILLTFEYLHVTVPMFRVTLEFVLFLFCNISLTRMNHVQHGPLYFLRQIIFKTPTGEQICYTTQYYARNIQGN